MNFMMNIRTSGFTEADQEMLSASLSGFASGRKSRQGLGYSNDSKNPETENTSDFSTGLNPLKRQAELIASTQIEKLEEKCSDELSSKSSKLDEIKARVRGAMQAALERNSVEHNSGRTSEVKLTSILRDAIDNDNEISINEAYTLFKSETNDSNQSHSKSIPSIIAASDHSDTYNSSTQGQLNASLPLYKRLKAGDKVLARYGSDGLSYEAVIKSVIHKGFMNAKYDIIYEGYESIETISWRDIIEEDIVQASASLKQSSEFDDFGRDNDLHKSKSNLLSTSSKLVECCRRQIKLHSLPAPSLIATMTAESGKKSLLNMGYVNDVKESWFASTSI